jgi:hypothetical protein
MQTLHSLRRLRNFNAVRTRALLLALVALAAPTAWGAKWLESGYENAHVVVPPDASPQLLEAAQEFVRLWKTWSSYDITYSTVNTGGTCIWVGKDAMPESLAEPASLDGLGPDGFLIRTYIPNRRDHQYKIGPHLVIAGNTDAATHAAVIEFFDRYLGFRWYAPGVESKAPKYDGVPEADLRFSPTFRFREIGYHGMWTGEKQWADWRRLSHLPAEFQPSHRRYPGEAIPPAVEVDLAAESTAIAAAQWINAHAHSTPDTLPRGARTLLWRDEAGQPVFTWTLNRVPTLDPALDDFAAEALPAVLQLCNRVLVHLPESAMLRVALPDSSPLPPDATALSPRIIIQLSDIACDFSRPLIDRHCDENAHFLDALEAWKQTGATLFVSHHIASFHNNIAPFPNLLVLRDNLYAFTRYGVQGVYAESWDSPALRDVDNARLRAYLLARLLWNPDQVVEDLIADFYQITFQGATEQMLRFDRAFADAVATGDTPLRVLGPPAWLTPPSIAAAEKALNAALALELDDRTKERINERLSTLEYARLICPPVEATDANGNPIWRRPQSRALEQILDRLQKRGHGKPGAFNVIEAITAETDGITPPREEPRN